MPETQLCRNLTLRTMAVQEICKYQRVPLNYVHTTSLISRMCDEPVARCGILNVRDSTTKQLEFR
jgi:hypothetical protein